MGPTVVTCEANLIIGISGPKADASCTFNVTVNDVEPPVFIACFGSGIGQADPGACTLAWDLSASFSPTDISDNCPGVTIDCEPKIFPVGTTDVTCTATDASGNTATCIFPVTVDDTQPPTITCPSGGNGEKPGPIVVANDPGECGAVVSFTPDATDNCSVSVVCIPPSGSFFVIGSTDVNCTATDPSGNEASCTFTVQVDDTEPPLRNCQDIVQPTDSEISIPFAKATRVGESGISTGQLGLAFNANDVLYLVNYNGEYYTVDTATGVPTYAGYLDLGGDTNAHHGDFHPVSGMYYGIDVHNTGSGARNLVRADLETGTVVDRLPTVDYLHTLAFLPTVPARLLGTVGAGVEPSKLVEIDPDTGALIGEIGSVGYTVNGLTWDATTGKLYGGTSKNDSAFNGLIEINLATGAGTPVGHPALSKNWGGTSPQSVVDIDVDSAGRMFAWGEDLNGEESDDLCWITMDAGHCGAVVTYPPADNCPGATVVCVPPSGSMFLTGATTVNCSATDASGNTAECSFTVTVNDAQPPMLTPCPQDIVQNTDPGLCSAVVTFTDPTAFDFCDGVVPVTCDPASGSVFPKGLTVVTCSATDASGNTGSCSFNVTVEDHELPVITCHVFNSEIVLSADAGQCSRANVEWADPTATDNCTVVSIDCVPPKFSTFPVGTTTVSCTATDDSGNVSLPCTFRITVLDIEPPVVSNPGDQVFATDGGLCTKTNVQYILPIGVDNCDPSPWVQVECVPPPGSFFDKGVNVVSCSAEDLSGNTTTCTFNVIIEDRENPTITCYPPARVDVDGCVSVPVTFADPTTSDNCPGETWVCVPASGSTFAVGTNTVVCTATDASANTASCSFPVVVNARPEISWVWPTNNTTFVVPQTINLTAGAFDCDPNDGVARVRFYDAGTFLGDGTFVGGTNWVFAWANASVGVHDQITAVATDRVGVSRTTANLTLTVLAHVPLTAGPVETNTPRVIQTGLFFQEVTIHNPTPLALAGVEVFVQVAAPFTVNNAVGTKYNRDGNLLPYVVYSYAAAPVPPGGTGTLTMEYYTPDRRLMPAPVFTGDLLLGPTEPSASQVNTVPGVRVTPVTDMRTVLLQFASVAGREYWVQYTDDIGASPVVWRTAAPAIIGNGTEMQWLDNGPPKTAVLPGDLTQRFYKIVW